MLPKFKSANKSVLHFWPRFYIVVLGMTFFFSPIYFFQFLFGLLFPFFLRTFIFPFLFGLLFPFFLGTFIFSLDFYFPFSHWTFISLFSLDFYFLFGRLFNRGHILDFFQIFLSPLLNVLNLKSFFFASFSQFKTCKNISWNHYLRIHKRFGPIMRVNGGQIWCHITQVEQA